MQRSPLVGRMGEGHAGDPFTDASGPSLLFAFQKQIINGVEHREDYGVLAARLTTPL